MDDREPTEPSLRARLATPRWRLPPVIALVGIVLIVAGSGTVEIVGGGLVAIAVTVAISLVFLEVGYSEDRARARGEYGPQPPPRDRDGG